LLMKHIRNEQLLEPVEFPGAQRAFRLDHSR
jgi:hypothetical protein